METKNATETKFEASKAKKEAVEHDYMSEEYGSELGGCLWAMIGLAAMATILGIIFLFT